MNHSTEFQLNHSKCKLCSKVRQFYTKKSKRNQNSIKPLNEFIDTTLQHPHESKSKARVRDRNIFEILVQLELLPIELHLRLIILLFQSLKKIVGRTIFLCS